MPGSEDWAAFLAERPIAVVATVSRDGSPHAVPVEVVVHGGLVYVWCESWSVKGHNARREGRVALTAYKGQAGVLVRGAARIIAEGEAGYEDITRRFLDKYRREETFGNDLIIEITPERVAAWD